MKAAEQQLQVSLRVCAERGESAIRLLEQGDISGCLRVLRWRKAAFHNARVAWGRLSELSGCFSEQITALAGRVQSQDIKLMDLMADELNKTGYILADLARKRSKIGQFRTIKSPSGHFNRAV